MSSVLTGAVGTWVKLPTIETVQVMAYAGFDFVVVDQEHAPIDDRTAYQLISAAAADGLLPLVRVDQLRGPTVQRILDAGAEGVLVPHVDTAEQADAAVRAVRFPPRGTRGAGGTSRAGRWGTLPAEEYRRHGDREVLCVPQLESAEALANVRAIAEVDGVDAVFIGVADLSMDMGTTPADPAVVELYLAALAVVHETGKPCGFAAATAAGAAAARAHGFDFVMASSDTAMLVAEARSVAGGARGGDE